MNVLLCNSSATLPLSQSSLSSPKAPPTKFSFSLNLNNHTTTWARKTFLGALTGVLSFNLLLSSPFSLASQSPYPQLQLPSPPNNSSIEQCQEQEQVEQNQESVTNEGIVEEAWQIVNDSFLDAGRHRWTPQSWQQKKEDILSTSIQSRSKAHDLIKRMLASLGDPYTRFLSPAEFSKMARYDMSGIGINLREVPEENGEVKLKVLGLLLDGPAYTAGVKQGDEILAVNGEDVRGKSAFEVSSSLQGPNETFVTIKVYQFGTTAFWYFIVFLIVENTSDQLQVKHGNCGPIQSLEVQRQLVARTPVFYRLEQVDKGTTSVGYMRLKEFNALARKDLVIAMKRLKDMGASYFILDLRDNLGGLVQAGIEISKLFLNEGEKVIYTVGRDPQYQNTIVADTAPLVTAPVIVLVNNNTASASEIVASALHDNCRAVLVGERTFGKGLIQSVFELHDGSGVVVTVGKYVTPNHMDINGNGIEPDYRNFPAWSDVTRHLSQCNMNRRG
ncbi:carboxyl-terminal-processing peptidase 1, chloroplastic isoform X1 [Ricinus communis]|uniref:carboxyl-terminal-processing peptidase 1, chloroplastic isoform X1 n=1 Tax=Ricinus communis TaxID=3988 RepID=UPI00201B1C10|nr:carboxyl-terminal-processing peptidase 1, chloroplastic isoform X1 [Ricinus communis]